MKNDYIKNILIILFSILIFFGIGFIIYKDINNTQKHLEKCKEICYPNIVVVQFSGKKCFCQETQQDLNEE